jgi:hypothetical protein
MPERSAPGSSVLGLPAGGSPRRDCGCCCSRDTAGDVSRLRREPPLAAAGEGSSDCEAELRPTRDPRGGTALPVAAKRTVGDVTRWLRDASTDDSPRPATWASRDVENVGETCFGTRGDVKLASREEASIEESPPRSRAVNDSGSVLARPADVAESGVVIAQHYSTRTSKKRHDAVR